MVKRKSKKGSVRDLFFIIAFLFGFGLVFFMTYKIYFSVIDGLKQSQIGTDTAAVDAMDKVGDTIEKVDYFFMVVFFIMIISMLISAFMVDFHPVFYVIFIIAWIIAIIFATIMSVMFVAMVDSNDFFGNTSVGVAATMPLYNYFMRNLPLYTTVLGFLLVIVMFVKTKNRNVNTGV